MKRKHSKTLELIFHRPVSGNIKWEEIEALLISLGAETIEREGSRMEDISLRRGEGIPSASSIAGHG